MAHKPNVVALVAYRSSERTRGYSLSPDSPVDSGGSPPVGADNGPGLGTISRALAVANNALTLRSDLICCETANSSGRGSRRYPGDDCRDMQWRPNRRPSREDAGSAGRVWQWRPKWRPNRRPNGEGRSRALIEIGIPCAPDDLGMAGMRGCSVACSVASSVACSLAGRHPGSYAAAMGHHAQRSHRLPVARSVARSVATATGRGPAPSFGPQCPNWERSFLGPFCSEKMKG